MVDDESPARIVAFDAFKSGSWRPQEAFAAQVLDATIRLINRVHLGGQVVGNGPVDFVLVSGDVSESGQYNEVRWFIDTMDGGTVTPDSGEHDGPYRPVPADINPHLPFKAAGLSKDIPWYVLIGNHDNQLVGNFTVDRSSPDSQDWNAPMSPTVSKFLGLPDLSPPQDAFFPTGNQSLAILRAGDPEPIDPYTCQLKTDALQAGAIVPDPDRHYMSKQLFIAEHFKTKSFPGGHGFDATSALTGDAHYTFRLKRDIPLRVIVIDSVGPDAIQGFIGASGAITMGEFNGYLKPKMRAAKEAGEYVILVSHHPSTDIVKPTVMPCVTEAEFTSYLATQPNLIAHVCGHMHYHDVIMHSGPYPYPEILTGSLIDYPQEVRMLDVYYDRRAKTFNLRSTFLSYADNLTPITGEAYKRMTTDLFVDPDGPDYAGHVVNLDLSGVEDYLVEGHAAKSMAYAPRVSMERNGRTQAVTISVPRPELVQRGKLK